MIGGQRELPGKLERQLTGLTDYFALPEDRAEVRLRKALLVLSSLLFTLAGLLWGTIYLWFGEVTAGLIPLAYAFVSLLSLAYFRLTRRFNHYRLSQLLLILILPVLLMAALGGFRAGSAAILWAIVSPLGALLFATQRRAHRWLAAYLILLASMGVLEPSLRAPNRLPAWLVTSFFVLNIGAVTVIFYMLLSYFISERDRIQALLRREQEKSERLLLNVLPEEIAPLLKENKTVAERFDSASILFADLVGFTQLSAQMPAEQVVDMLNSIVSHFDQLAEKHNVEKIRTIGDSYMVAAGVPRPRPDHAQVLASMALEMREHVLAREPNSGPSVSIRMGMATGSVIGAVIGKTKFHYDVWGDAVNLASRLESRGVPNAIQIDRETRRKMGERFECRYRGELDLKGLGQVETWFLEGLSEALD